MSSAEDEFNEHDNALAMPGSKKRRVQRACDICRRKKSDGSQMPGHRCSNCIAYNFDCTYVEAAKVLTVINFSYVESLENRLEKMENLLQKLCPDADFSQELGGGPMDRETWQKGNMNGSTSHVMTPYAATPLEDLVSSDDDEMVSVRLADHMQNMSINPMQTRFFGKSSGIMLVQKAIDLKKEYTGDDEIHRQDVLQPKRPEFHGCFPWELAAKHIVEPSYSFPHEDLATSLVDLYFTHLNVLTPLLHRPTFERKAAQGLHRRNSSFGAAQRFSDDPRVLLDGENEHSAGWKFFEQVQMVRKTLLGPPCLEDLQVYCLSVLYLQGTSAPQACWTIVGIGIRLAQDVGAHRRKAYGNKPTVEEELWKRAFWVLVSLDRLMSSSFDLDLPVECDDEYWEHPDPDQMFKQPADKPSLVSHFVNFLKLNHILAFALRTIYSINKLKVLLGFVGQQWEQQIVAELDSALNKWIDAVPDHLRWDPNRDINDFFLQSHSLYSSYYHVQILIHRPFIPSPRKPSPLSFPSLAICTNAARSCSHVMDVYRRRSGQSAPYSQMPAFTAGIVLLLNIWGGKRSGLYTDPTKEMADVHKCMSVLKVCEKRWHTAGRLWDILYELASVGDLPLPQPSPSGGTKRERDSDSPISAPPTTSPPSDVPRTIAGSRRIGREAAAQSRSNPLNSFNLPLYSDDLGRLPLHGQVNFANTSPSLSSSTNNMWYPHVGGNPVQPHATQTSMQNVVPPQDYSQTAIPAYSMDDMFYEQMSQYSAQYQPQGTATTSSYDDDAQGLQTLMNGTPQQNVLSHPGASIMDTDTIAMWSNAPTGFELNDWGTYITNVSGMVNPDGSASHSRHGP
ncbi:fungal-specific transcription factor domain-containing protein [Suillus paluster]|uniref:fungal-specific transcription factor domain-containing protein n=1 Tax=Suillus paluster TaxID=48578 RepID=UPI001B86FBD4|nr:fungal-specific transcription factor domain-containing protein [Suillus paluster]KAG1729861.1 fungal-specific transcription factor domain-containing protein [Suillus paluster]